MPKQTGYLYEDEQDCSMRFGGQCMPAIVSSMSDTKQHTWLATVHLQDPVIDSRQSSCDGVPPLSVVHVLC